MIDLSLLTLLQCFAVNRNSKASMITAKPVHNVSRRKADEFTARSLAALIFACPKICASVTIPTQSKIF